MPNKKVITDSLTHMGEGVKLIEQLESSHNALVAQDNVDLRYPAGVTDAVSLLIQNSGMEASEKFHLLVMQIYELGFMVGAGELVYPSTEPLIEQTAPAKEE